MRRKREKGFTLILSLVLLLVMSLMGGSLIVVTSSDHSANNTSDQYQQAFYVAETALLEAEKDIINSFIGKWTTTCDDDGCTTSRDPATKGLPPDNDQKIEKSARSACYNSFKNITFHSDEALPVVKHNSNVSFYNLIEPIFGQLTVDDGSSKEIDREKEVLKKYTYEYFMVNLGRASYTEEGSSIAATAIDVVTMGTAYKIYACGMYNDDEVVIPLESVMVLPSAG